jgi:hypothetical protein
MENRCDMRATVTDEATEGQGSTARKGTLIAEGDADA